MRGHSRADVALMGYPADPQGMVPDLDDYPNWWQTCELLARQEMARLIEARSAQWPAWLGWQRGADRSDIRVMLHGDVVGPTMNWPTFLLIAWWLRHAHDTA